jgi:hypothetical protein
MRCTSCDFFVWCNAWAAAKNYHHLDRHQTRRDTPRHGLAKGKVIKPYRQKTKPPHAVQGKRAVSDFYTARFLR